MSIRIAVWKLSGHKLFFFTPNLWEARRIEIQRLANGIDTICEKIIITNREALCHYLNESYDAGKRNA
jgi:hypothetical protein